MQRLVVAQKSDRGLKRAVNEDACDFRIPASGTPEARFGALFVVADGVGSMGSGEHASRAAVDTLLDSYYDPELDDEDLRERLVAAVQDAHEAVLARVRAFEGRSLGTTLVGAVVLPSGRMVMLNVGDSRIYRIRRHTAELLTVDQSAVDVRDAGSDRAKLTAYVGQPRPILPQISEGQLAPGDILVLCSDGLWGMVETADIVNIVRANQPDKAVERLIEKVYANGARDNVTVIVIRYGSPPRKKRLIVLLLLLLLILGAILIAAAQGQVAPATNTAPLDMHTAEATADTTPGLTEVTPVAENGGSLLIVRTPTASPD